MEPVQWDRDPERAAAADFVIRERAQHPTAPIPHTGEVRTGDFRMQGILMEELSTGVIPMARASGQAVADFHVGGGEDGLLAVAEAGGAGKNMRIPAQSPSTANLNKEPRAGKCAVRLQGGRGATLQPQPLIAVNQERSLWLNRTRDFLR